MQNLSSTKQWPTVRKKVGHRHVERDRVALSSDAPHALNRALTTINTHCAHSSSIPRLPAMEDTTMLDDSKGLFGDSRFTIIPNGLSEDRVNQVSAMRAHVRPIC
jgi:hypothetical protein